MASEKKGFVSSAAACEAEAEMPGKHIERLKLAAEDLCQMLNRQNRAVQAEKK